MLASVPIRMLLEPVVRVVKATPSPMAVLLLPVVTAFKAATPTAVLSRPVTLRSKACRPIATLASPDVLFVRALAPTATLPPPDVLFVRALAPTATFCKEGLLNGGACWDCSAWAPIATENACPDKSGGKEIPFWPPNFSPLLADMIFTPVDENSTTCVPSEDTSTSPLTAVYKPVLLSPLRAGLGVAAEVPSVTEPPPEAPVVMDVHAPLMKASRS